MDLISKEKKAKPKQNTDELNKCELSTFLSSQQIHTRSVLEDWGRGSVGMVSSLAGPDSLSE